MVVLIVGEPGRRRRETSHSLRGAREESEESSSLTWALKGASQVEKEHGGRASPREHRRCCGGCQCPGAAAHRGAGQATPCTCLFLCLFRHLPLWVSISVCFGPSCRLGHKPWVTEIPVVARETRRNPRKTSRVLLQRLLTVVSDSS